jgi:ribosomal protein S18 acetylase RimI-like enzyme
MTVKIRHAMKDDAEAVARLIEEVERFYGATTIQPFAERLSQVEQALFDSPALSYMLLAEDDSGETVGFAAYSFLWPAVGSTHSIFLKELYVRQSTRRAGVATALVNELRVMAATRPGCSRLEWMTDSSNNGARAFYRSLGIPEFEGRVVYRLEGDQLPPMSSP